MSRQHGGEEVLQFTPFLKGSDAIAKRVGILQFSPYKLALFVHDVGAVLVAFVLSAWITGLSPFLWYNTAELVSFFMLAPVLPAFFITYNLYNYHLIFLRKSHLFNLSKAFAWSLFSLSVVALILVYPDLFKTTSLIPLIFLAAVGVVLVSRFFGDQLLHVLKAIGISFLVVGIIGLVNESENPAVFEYWLAIPVGFLFAIAITFVTRATLVHVVFNNLMRRRFRRQVAIIGSGEEAQRITTHIVENNAPFWVSGFLAPKSVSDPNVAVKKDRLGALRDLPHIVEREKIEEIIVTDEGIDKRVLISLLDYCTSERLTVWFPPQLMPIIDLKLYVDNFCGLPMIRLCSQKNTYFFNKIKHGLDALVVLPLLLLLLPVFAVIALVIKLNSRGPAFYCAAMVGKGGKSFTMCKFRSMKVETGNQAHKEYVKKLINGDIREESGKGGVFKMTEDQRVTSVGGLLRKFSLDELPQIINVLKGEMSLVGPRPCLPYEYEMYKDWHRKRLSVRPGITGVWQVAGRSAVAFEDMVLLDLYYVYNRSLSLDISILYETIFAVLERKGAY